MKQINSYTELRQSLPTDKTSWLLLYKKGSEQSDCAFANLEDASKEHPEYPLFVADVLTVKDIHTEYGVSSVPTLLIFENGNFVSTHKGCNAPDYYTSVFENALFSASAHADGKPKQKSVTVYSTPTCSWCTRLKNYLNDKGVKYKDIDVSKDTKAAEAMVKKSGQQGVPQTTIGSEHIVGFDKTRIDTLLGLG